MVSLQNAIVYVWPVHPIWRTSIRNQPSSRQTVSRRCGGARGLSGEKIWRTVYRSQRRGRERNAPPSSWELGTSLHCHRPPPCPKKQCSCSFSKRQRIFPRPENQCIGLLCLSRSGYSQERWVRLSRSLLIKIHELLFWKIDQLRRACSKNRPTRKCLFQ